MALKLIEFWEEKILTVSKSTLLLSSKLINVILKLIKKYDFDHLYPPV